MKQIESRALIHVPDGKGPHPVLCFLHGMGEAATSDSEGRVPQLLSRVLVHEAPGWHAQQNSAFISRFIVVSPQLEIRRRWQPSDATWIDALMRSVLREHDGDESRLTLSGFSLGGEGIFHVAGASSLAWPTLWAVDPAVRQMPVIPAESTRVWVHYGSWARTQIQLLPEFLVALAVTPWRGDPSARRVVSELSEDHEATCKAAYGSAQVYDWLLQ
jgi:hypothetical protein